MPIGLKIPFLKLWTCPVPLISRHEQNLNFSVVTGSDGWKSAAHVAEKPSVLTD